MEKRCRWCNKVIPKDSPSRCTTCAEKRRVYDRARRARLRVQRKCIQCAMDAPVGLWGLCPTCYTKNTNFNPKRFEYGATYRRKLKLAALDAYGGRQCKCCAESIIDMLTIDHIENGGAKHRQAIGKPGNAFYKWLKANDYPEGFQILCWNCNWGKRMYGVCPHESLVYVKGK